MRENRSRPTSSVPSQCPWKPGGLSRVRTDARAGSWVATRGAAIAARTTAARISVTPTVTGSRHTRRQTVGQYAETGSAAGGRDSATGSASVVSVAIYRRMRGSIAAWSTSTATLITTNTVAMARIVADSTGTS